MEPHAAALMGRFMEAQTTFAELPEKEQPEHMGLESGRCVDWMVDYICAHREPVKLLLCCAEGTSYEHFVHNMVEVEVEYTQRYMEVLRRLSRDIPVLDKSLCHIIASGMFNGIFEIVVHDMPGSGDAGCGSVAGVLHRWLVKTDGGIIPYLFEIWLVYANFKRRFFMKQKRKSDVAVLLDYAGSHKGLTFLGWPYRRCPCF